MTLITPTLNKMMEAFENSGFNIRLVGGCVRDYVLGKEPKDIDLCTDARPEEMESLASQMAWKFFPTGIQHGTVTLKVDDELYEVTTLRVDDQTDGRHAVVRFVTDFKTDAARRDFTMNAMFMDRQGNIADFFGGQDDLVVRRIRFVGDTRERIREDYLRILRLFRFSQTMGLSIDPDDMDIIDEESPGLRQVSVERYWLEMKKLMDGPGNRYKSTLRKMSSVGVLEVMGLTYMDRVRYALTPEAGLAALGCDTSEWKLSAEESKAVNYFVQMFDKGPRTMPIAYYQDKLVSGVPLAWVRQEAYYNNDSQFIWFLNRWEIPVFPVKGQDLLDRGMKPGPEVGVVLRKMVDSWRQSRYTKSKEELLVEFGFGAL